MIDTDAIVRASEPGICSVEYSQVDDAVGIWTVDVLRSALLAA